MKYYDPISERQELKGTIQINAETKVFKDQVNSIVIKSDGRDYYIFQMDNIEGKYKEKKQEIHYSCKLIEWKEAIELVKDDLRANQR